MTIALPSVAVYFVILGLLTAAAWLMLVVVPREIMASKPKRFDVGRKPALSQQALPSEPEPISRDKLKVKGPSATGSPARSTAPISPTTQATPWR